MSKITIVGRGKGCCIHSFEHVFSIMSSNYGGAIIPLQPKQAAQFQHISIIEPVFVGVEARTRFARIRARPCGLFPWTRGADQLGLALATLRRIRPSFLSDFRFRQFVLHFSRGGGVRAFM